MFFVKLTALGNEDIPLFGPFATIADAESYATDFVNDELETGTEVTINILEIPVVKMKSTVSV